MLNHAENETTAFVHLFPPLTMDGYARRGIALPRDAASLVHAALRRDAYEMRRRGGSANLNAASVQESLADSILKALR